VLRDCVSRARAASLPYMDFPPGDWYSPVVVNDTTATVGVAAIGTGSTDVAVIAPGKSASLLADAHGGTRFVVSRGRDGSTIGCLDPPGSATGDVRSNVQLLASAAKDCNTPIHNPAAGDWVLMVLTAAAVAAMLATGLGVTNVVRTRPHSLT